jgi:hypothetical protein
LNTGASPSHLPPSPPIKITLFKTHLTSSFICLTGARRGNMETALSSYHDDQSNRNGPTSAIGKNSSLGTDDEMLIDLTEDN